MNLAGARKAMTVALAAVGLSAMLWPGVAWAVGTIDDRLPMFLTSVGYGSGQAWMAFEAAHGKEMDLLFYRDRSSAQKMDLARRASASWVPVGQVLVLSQRWRTDFEVVAGRLESLSGQLPYINVAMWYSMDSRPWVFVETGGKSTMAYNARFFVPYDAIRNRMRFAESFFQAFSAQMSNDMAERMTLSHRFQIEGLKLAVVQRAVPGLALQRYLGVSAQTYASFQRNQKAIARGMLTALDAPESTNAMQRFFGYGFGDPWPPGSGRYIAFMCASAIANEHNPLELAAMPSRDYLFLVRGQLESMGRIEEGLSP